MSISFPNSDVWDESSTSNLLTTTMKQMIHRAEKGSRIWIDKIKAKSPDGVEYFLKEIALRVD